MNPIRWRMHRLVTCLTTHAARRQWEPGVPAFRRIPFPRGGTLSTKPSESELGW